MCLTPSTCVSVSIMGLSLILGIQTIATADVASTLALTSPAFQNGSAIPERYTCSGQNVSPELMWTGVPHGTRSFALILDDPDAPMGTFVHWVVYNLSPATTAMPEGVSASASVGDGEQGLNGRGALGYTGPCPPSGKPHHYHFRLYALDKKLQLQAGATAEQAEAAIKGHVLATTELIGIFER
jgi:Raf kinase inhibitor-like YbhB/YbcL family protein